MSSPTCYFPDHSEGPGLVAAIAADSSGHSPCCFEGHYLFSNGLCLDNNQSTFYRGGCTDQAWASSACPRYCMSVSQQQCGVWACNNANQFACNLPDCGDSSLMFTVNGGVIQQNAALEAVIPTTTSASSTTATSASSTTTTSSSSTASLTALTTNSPTTSPLSTGNVCPSHIGAYAGLGAGLGISLLISLAALVFVLLQLRKYRQSTVGNGVNGSSDVQQQKGYSPSPSSSNNFQAGYGHQVPQELGQTGQLEANRSYGAELESR